METKDKRKNIKNKLRNKMEENEPTSQEPDSTPKCTKQDSENWDDTSESEAENTTQPSKPQNISAGAVKLRSWLNQSLRIEMTDKRVLVGIFQCTDRDANIILSSCCEYLEGEVGSNEEPRMLGLIMVPGKHIISISIDQMGAALSATETELTSSTEPLVV